ncbi:unnamed protein product, partial [Lymnaea stagnalis]
LQITSVGNATFKGCIDLSYSKQLYQDLKKNQPSVNLVNSFHLHCLVTPYNIADSLVPDWKTY